MSAPSVAASGTEPAVSSADAITYLGAALHALVREEQVGRRPRRLLEPGQATWHRFRGRLGLSDFVQLLLEDAAVVQPEPFDVRGVLGSTAEVFSVPEAQLGDWLAEFARLHADVSDRDYL